MNLDDKERRGWIVLVGSAAAGTVLVGCRREKPAAADREEEEGKEKGLEVTPTEDLMREHGLLNRVLLIYDECGQRIERRAEFNPESLGRTAKIIRTFVEEYHEKLEEDHLFPRFEKAHKLEDLVATLRAQHLAGRKLTAQIEALATGAALKNAGDRRKLAAALAGFVRMYRPHEAREDTILFPAVREIVSPNEYGALGEQFEDMEHKRFGEEGFEKNVDSVAGIEKELGIYELAQFTPSA